MATHFSTLAWKIPWKEEPGRLQSMGLLRVGHDWATSLPLFTFMHWRRKWQPNPVFLPGESQGWGSLVGCHLWGGTELDTTEVMQQQQQYPTYCKEIDKRGWMQREEQCSKQKEQSERGVRTTCKKLVNISIYLEYEAGGTKNRGTWFEM